METISIVKNLLRILTVLYITSSTAFASASSLEDFYIRADGGAFVVQGGAKTISGVRGKVKPKHCAGVVDVGLGYYIKDKFRVELAYGHVFNSKLKGKSYGIDYNNIDPGYPVGITKADVIGTSKASVNILILNGYYDVADFDKAKIFVGLGAGIAKIKEKVTGIISVTTTGTTSNTVVQAKLPDINVEDHTKHHPSFIYAVHIGIERKLAEKVNMELIYSFRDFTYTRYRMNIGSNKAITSTNQFRGHNILIGFRRDI